MRAFYSYMACQGVYIKNKLMARRKPAVCQKEKSMKNFKSHLLTFIVLIIMAVLALGSDDSDKDKKKNASSGPPVEDRTPVGTFTAAQLHNMYNNNRVAADAAVKGKFIKVIGIIHYIGKTLGDPYVQLETGGLEINVFFGRGNDDQVIDLQPGQRITVIGKCKGERVMMVMIDNARIVK